MDDHPTYTFGPTSFTAIVADASDQDWSRILDQCVTWGLGPVLLPLGFVLSKLLGRPVGFWRRQSDTILPQPIYLFPKRPVAAIGIDGASIGGSHEYPEVQD